jgi:hypothetical protein
MINLKTIIIIVVICFQPVFGYPIAEVVERTTKRKKEIDPSKAVRTPLYYFLQVSSCT